MNKTKCTLSVLAAFLFVITCATAGQASAQRTFVAGPGIGNDTNTASDCSFSAPCRNFSAAFGVTNTGGEIIALSPGVGYGGLTITHAITVTGLPGQVAFVAVVASSTGFTVSAGASELVVVRNISFNGSGAASSTGLLITSGRLVIEDCNFSQLATGLRGTGGTVVAKGSSFTSNSSKGVHVSGSAKADLLACLITNNGTGVTADGNCTSVFVHLDGGSVINNTLGFEMLNGVCSPDAGSLPQNIFIRQIGTGISAIGPNISGNTTNVGPSPGAGLQAGVGLYSSVRTTTY